MFSNIKDVAGLDIVSDLPSDYLAIVTQLKLRAANCWLLVTTRDKHQMLNWFNTIDIFTGCTGQ